jgi:hypothetical protein
VSEYPRFRLGTEEDLLREFGSGGFMIGFPVRPKPEADDEHDDDSEQQAPGSSPPWGKSQNRQT